MKNKKGFTLVELLAAITILAIIVVIAVPKIISTISNNKNSMLTESARSILRQAEYYDVDTTISSRIALSTLNLDISENDYDLANSYIYKENDMIYLDLIGQGKFEGYTCNGDKNSVECGDSTLALNVLKNSGNMYQDDTVDHNYRYKGANPNNYVKFNGEEWRIIGIFKVSNGSITKQRIKIIGPSIGSYSWDSSPTTAISGNGYNIWETKTSTTYKDSTNDRTTKADINILLNELYHDGTSITCYGGTGNLSKSCPTARLNSTAKGMIGNATWNLGGLSAIYLSSNEAYTAERGTNVYSPTITKTEWTGKVGLIYPSDYGYANGNKDTNCSTLDRTACKTNNWLANASIYWTLASLNINNSYVVCVREDGSACIAGAYYASPNVRPVVYLKSNIKITSGNGTSGANAYELSI